MNPQETLRQLNATYSRCLSHNDNEMSLFQWMEYSFLEFYYVPIKEPRNYLTELIRTGHKDINMYEAIEYCATYIYKFKNALKAYTPRNKRVFGFSNPEATIEALKDFLDSLHRYMHKDQKISTITIATLYDLLIKHDFSEASLIELLKQTYPTQFRANPLGSFDNTDERHSNVELELTPL